MKTDGDNRQKIGDTTCLVRWVRSHMPEQAYSFLMAVVIGLMAGVAADVFKSLVAHISRFLTSGLREGAFNWQLLVLPLVGIIITGILCRYIMRRRLANGVAQLVGKLKNKDYRLDSALMYSPLLASTFTLGFGGSAGGEGPIAYAGAAIGSNVGRWMGTDRNQMRILVGCGAGAGIAAIFKSPLGGAFFTLEVLQMPLSTLSVLMLMVAVVVAAMTSYALSGFALDVSFNQSAAFDPAGLPLIILLGVLCGFYALYYRLVMHKVGSLLNRIGNPWVKNILAGSLLSVLVFLFPALYGEGYAVIGQMINGNFSSVLAYSPLTGALPSPVLLLVVCGALLLAKSFATSYTNYGGGVSGDFAPTLFAGCFVGYFFAMLLNSVFGLDVPVAHFAFYAMAGVMAGAVRAPLMAMFLTCEIGAAYAYFLPLALTASISYGVVRLLSKH